jgi:flagellin
VINMPLYINTNVASLQSQKNPNRVQQTLQTSFQRLSSGFRINSASDDAAGFDVAESLRARIRSFSVAERNTNNAISMAQTAEGGLDEISGIIIRMRDLAVQSANGDLTSTNRSDVNTKFSALQEEIDRLAESTEFNGIELLAGTVNSVNFQVGINTTSSDTIGVSFGGISLSSLGLSGASVGGASSANATAAITAIDAALTTVSTSRATFGAAMNRLGIAAANSQTMRANLEAANSVMRDVDVAQEAAVLARSQVLLQRRHLGVAAGQR